jgi:hypothetical protein
VEGVPRFKGQAEQARASPGGNGGVPAGGQGLEMGESEPRQPAQGQGESRHQPREPGGTADRHVLEAEAAGRILEGFVDPPALLLPGHGSSGRCAHFARA